MTFILFTLHKYSKTKTVSSFSDIFILNLKEETNFLLNNLHHGVVNVAVKIYSSIKIFISSLVYK